MTALAASASAYANEHSIKPFLYSHSYSSLAPIKQVIDDNWLSAPNKTADKAFSQSIAGVSYQANNYRISALYRLDYVIDSNPDTALAYYQNSKKKALLNDSAYDIKLKFQQLESKGLAFGYDTNMGDITAQFDLFVWQVESMRESRLNGQVIGGDKNKLLGQLDLTESYTGKNFLKRPYNGNWQTQGTGLSLNVSFQYKIDDAFSMEVELADLFNRFTIKQVGYTETNIDTKGSFIDNDGFESFRPLLKGKETSFDETVYLPAYLNTEIRYQPEKWGVVASVSKRADEVFSSLGVLYDFGYLKLEGAYDFLHQTPELKIESNWFKINVASDSIDTNKIKNLKLGLSLAARF